MENEVIDTKSTEAQASTQAPDISTEPEAQELDKSTPDAATTEAERKWKLKVYGEEREYSEPELLKLAQLGGAGQQAMNKAALIEKKQREFYGWLQEALAKDPLQVAEIITGKKYQAAQQASPNGEAQEQLDPRDLKIRELEEKYGTLAQRIEQEEVEKERQVIQQEITAAVKKYPELDSPYLQSYVKQEYRKALMNGVTDLSIEDVAFYVAQDVKNREAQKLKATQERFEEKKKQAPVVTAPGAASGKTKSMTLDDVKRLAGRTV